MSKLLAVSDGCILQRNESPFNSEWAKKQMNLKKESIHETHATASREAR